jgi:hypothetical protein
MLKPSCLIMLLSALAWISTTIAFAVPGRPAFSAGRVTGAAFVKLQAAFERNFEVSIQTHTGYKLGGNDTVVPAFTPDSLLTLPLWEPIGVTQQPVDPRSKVVQLE